MAMAGEQLLDMSIDAANLMAPENVEEHKFETKERVFLRKGRGSFTAFRTDDLEVGYTFSHTGLRSARQDK